GYGYDARGNRWVSSHTGLPSLTSDTPQTSSWFDANNRVATWSYDGSGNLLQPTPMNYVFAYDAENRQIRATINGQATTYDYDGDGRRVRKVGPSGTTVFVYDAGGNLTSEYSTGVISSTTGVSYLSSDMLGSTRLVSDALGQTKACMD